jgi:hypothetical protein
MSNIERKLATIQRIESVGPIAGADAIERITVKGWELVAKKGEFKEGDLCVFFEIDSLLPDAPIFEFMRSRKFRVKTIKLRGQVSQGLALPIKEINDAFPKTNGFMSGLYTPGSDLTAEIGVTKWEPGGGVDNDPKQKKRSWFRLFFGRLLYGRNYVSGGSYDFPTHLVSKTDEERVQNVPGIATKHMGERCYVTEKVDGQSATYLLIESRFLWMKKLKYAVCSRNRMTLSPEKVSKNFRGHIAAGKESKIEDVLRFHFQSTGEVVAIQGEVIGPDVQKNKYGRDGYSLRVFNVHSVTKGKPYNFDEMVVFCKKYDLLTVPINDSPMTLTLSPEMDVKFFIDMSKGKSKLADIQREGIVIRSTTRPNISFKAINPDFLIKWDE